MAYRAYKPPKPKRRRTMAAGSTPACFYVANGTTANFALPCYYLEIKPPIKAHPHCHHHHDHIGWPNPDNPGRVCQPREFAHACEDRHALVDELDLEALTPIHLEDEGYTQFVVNLPVDADKHLVAEAAVDKTQDWVVRLWITANSQDALEEHVDVPFSVVGSRLESDVNGEHTLSDQLAHGIIRILPAQLGV